MKLSIDQTLDRAVALHAGGELQAAESLYRAILQEQPSKPEANHNLGLLAVAGGFAEEALPFFMTAIKSSPNTEQFWFSYIDCLIKGQNFEAAQRTLHEVREAGASPRELDSLEQQILDSSYQNKGVRGAGISQHADKTLSLKQKGKKEAQKKSKKKKSSTTAVPAPRDLERLVGHFEAGDFDKAEEIARWLTCEFPDHEFGWKALGAVLKQTGRTEESIVVMRRSVELAPQDSEAHYNLGCVLQGLDRVAEAEAYYREAVVIKPDYSEAHCNLGVALLDAGKLPEAEESCRRAISFSPGDPEAHCNLGNVLKESGRLEEAEASYRQAVIANPEFVAAHSNLGVTLEELDKPEEAEASYSRAIAIDPDYAIARLNRAQVLFEKGQFEAALVDADFCDTDESRVRALETLFALGRYEEIYTRIERYADQDDTNIRMAAFSVFISEKLKKPTAHKFCPAPLSFFYSSSIAKHTSNADGFIAELVDELGKIEIIWEPPRKSTINGFQLPGSMNLFEQPRGKIAELESIIFDELDNYFSEFKNESCSFISRWPSQKRLHGWHVVLKRQGYQSAHIHPGGWMSGVIYLKVVPTLHKDEGAIELSLNGKNYLDKRSPSFIYRPSAGDIVLFPSSLHHRTIPFTTDADRMVIAFDLLPSDEAADLVNGRLQTESRKVSQSVTGTSTTPEASHSLNKLLKAAGRSHDSGVNDEPSIQQLTTLLERYQSGDLDESEFLANELTREFPRHQFGWKVLGAVLQETGRISEAKEASKISLEVSPSDPDAHNNFGNVLKALDEFEAAEASYRAAIALKPDYSSAHLNLGITLSALDKRDEAIASYDRALLLEPDNKQAKHMLAALTGDITESAPLEYVEKLFDGYARDFDSSLVDKLDYQTPKRVVDIILRHNNAGVLGTVLDLGCGTGLLGIEIAHACEYLEGLDVSTNMLQKADERRIYDKLVKQDIVSYLSSEALSFNYFIATDVFVYVGDLSEIFRLTRSRNNFGFRLAFSVEHMDGSGFALQPSGRYSHSEEYIEDLASKFCFDIIHFETLNLRWEKGSYIRGGLYLLSC